MIEDIDKIDIFSPEEKLLYSTPINNGCMRKITLMTEDYITAIFSDPEYIEFPTGSRVNDYYLTEPAYGVYNSITGGFDYNLRFNAYYWLWANRVLKYRMPNVESAPTETSFDLTGPIEMHIDVVLRAINAEGFKYKGESFGRDVDDTIENQSKHISYSNLSILDAINAIASEYECEWWVDGRFVCFGRCFDDAYSHHFLPGENVENIQITRVENTPNRIYVFGSDRNIPTNYRKLDNGDYAEGIVQRHLMLPEGIPYLQTREDIPDNELVETTVVFEDVYPKVHLKITNVETYSVKETDDNGNTVTKVYYRISYRNVSGEPFFFSHDYLIDDDLHIIFESGLLNGMDFGLKFNPYGVGEKLDDGSWNPNAQIFEIVANEEYGRLLPDKILLPEIDDEFGIYGWDSSKIADLGLISEAEKELLSEGEKLLDEYRKDTNTYTCNMMAQWCKDMREKYMFPYLGSSVMLSIVDGLTYRASRVIGYECPLDINYDNVKITLGDAVKVTRLKTLERKVDGLIHTGEKLKAQNSLDFISKRYPDRTPYSLGVGGKLTTGRGISSNTFVSGLTGTGFNVDKYGNFEADSLTLRKFLEVPELRFNRTEVICGLQWRAPGGGIIESVYPGNPTMGTISLKLEEGEIGAIKVGDICMGIYHFGNGLDSDVDSDTKNGNFAFTGFSTIYFQITEILDKTGINKTFSYELRLNPDGTAYNRHPQVGMHFVSYGSFTETDRMKSYYATRSYERYLDGVNNWTFEAQNVMMQLGDLSGLIIDGIDMSGYSAYLNNVYFTGVLHQLQTAPLRLTLNAVNSPYVGNGRSCIVKCEIFKGIDEISHSNHALTYDIIGNGITDEEKSLIVSSLISTGSMILNQDILHGQKSVNLQVTAHYEDSDQRDYSATSEITILDISEIKGDSGIGYTDNLLLGTRNFNGDWNLHDNILLENEFKGLDAIFINNSDTSADLVSIDAAMEYGKTYTLSFWAKGEGLLISRFLRNTFSELIATNGSSEPPYTTSTTICEYGNLSKTEWTRFYCVFKNVDRDTEDLSMVKTLEFRVNYISKVFLAGIKLELGDNRNPSWTPAPIEMIGTPGEKGEDGISYTPNLLNKTANWGASQWVDEDGGNMIQGTIDSLSVKFLNNYRSSRYSMLSNPNVLLSEDSIYTLSFKAKGEGALIISFPDYICKEIISVHSGEIIETHNASVRFALNSSYTQYAFVFRTYTELEAAQFNGSIIEALELNIECDGYSKASLYGIKLESGANNYPIWTPSLTDMEGAVGPMGGVIRIRGAYESNVAYYDGITTTSDGTKWKDIVWITDSIGNRSYFVCKKSHLSSYANMPTASGNSYWEEMNNLGATYTSLIFAENARIEFGSGQEFVFSESTGKIWGRIGTPTSDVIMYAGGSYVGNEGDNSGEAATYALYKSGLARFGNIGNRRIEIDPNLMEIRTYNEDNKLSVTIDGKEHSIDEAYSCKDNLTKYFAGTSETSSKTIELGKIVVGSSGLITARCNANAVAHTIALPSDASNPQLYLTSKVTITLYVISSQSGPVESKSITIEGERNITNPSYYTTTSTAKSGVLEISKELPSGEYSVRISINITNSDSATRNGTTYSCGGDANVNNYICSFKAGNQSKAYLGSNGLLAARSTLEYLKAENTDGGFIIEAVSGGYGFRVDSTGIKARDNNGQWKKLKLTFEES